MPSYSRGLEPIVIEATPNDVTAQYGFRTVVNMVDPSGTEEWIYTFYINSSGQLGFKKTVDGTLGSFVIIDAAPTTYTGVAVWWEQWTNDQAPYATSDIIHIIGANSTDQGLRYFQMDTDDSDAISGETLALSDTTIFTTPLPSICQSTDGTIYVTANFSNTTGIQMANSPTGVTWTDRGVIATSVSVDRGFLLPVKTGNDVVIVWIDTSGSSDTAIYNRWDAATDTFDGNTTIKSATGVQTTALCGVHDPVSGDLYILIRTILSDTTPATSGEYECYHYDESAETMTLQNTFKYNDTNSGDINGLINFSMCMDTSNNSLIVAMAMGNNATLNNLGVMFSYDLGVSFSDPQRIDGKVPDDYVNVCLPHHMADAALGLHIMYCDDDDNDILMFSIPVTACSSTCTDDSDVAVSGASVKVFIVDPGSGSHRMYYMGRAITNGSGIWGATVMDLEGDDLEVQVIYDEDLTNDEVDASHRRALSAF
jgi:hypothetical protein